MGEDGREQVRADPLVPRGCCGEGRLDLLPAAVTLGVLARACCLVAMVRNGGVGERPRRLPSRSAEADAAPLEAVLAGT